MQDALRQREFEFDIGQAEKDYRTAEKYGKIGTGIGIAATGISLADALAERKRQAKRDEEIKTIISKIREMPSVYDEAYRRTIATRLAYKPSTPIMPDSGSTIFSRFSSDAINEYINNYFDQVLKSPSHFLHKFLKKPVNTQSSQRTVQ